MINKWTATKFFIMTLIFSVYVPTLSAQDMDITTQRIMAEGTSFSFGKYIIEDTYLSPFTYTGWGGGILNERISEIKHRLSRQRIIGVDIATTKNPAENVNDFGTFVNYSLAYHYDIIYDKVFNLSAGGSANLMGGFIYNTRNGNNPLSAKVDLDVALSVMASYNFNIRNRHFKLTYQGVLPFAGIFFAPPYGASYYEMFNEGNTSDIIAFNSLNNKLSLKNYIVADIPVHNSTVRISYLFNYYKTDVKYIRTRIFSNTFMIGWVKYFYIK